MSVWWERRREDEPTASYLGRVLDAAGERELAEKARLYHYDDYFRPAEIDDGLNIHALVRDLQQVRTHSRPRRERLAAIVEAAKNGEFDGTREEAHQWEQTPEGQQALRELLEGA